MNMVKARRLNHEQIGIQAMKEMVPEKRGFLDVILGSSRNCGIIMGVMDGNHQQCEFSNHVGLNMWYIPKQHFF